MPIKVNLFEHQQLNGVALFATQSAWRVVRLGKGRVLTALPGWRIEQLSKSGKVAFAASTLFSDKEHAEAFISSLKRGKKR